MRPGDSSLNLTLSAAGSAAYPAYHQHFSVFPRAGQ